MDCRVKITICKCCAYTSGYDSRIDTTGIADKICLLLGIKSTALIVFSKAYHIIQSLLDAVSYSSPRQMMSAGSSADALVSAVNAKIQLWNIDAEGNVGSISNKAVSVVEFFYYNHPFEVKLAFAFYAWFFFYIDDIASHSSLEQFQQTIMSGTKQLSGPLASFPSVLAALYTHWDPICANFMVTAAMEFMSGTALEVRAEVVAMTIRPSAISWPRYLREKSGMAPGFSCAAFPRVVHPSITTYIQALPDIDEYLCLVNDILSFYKEDLAGETMNHVSVRAKLSGKHPKRVLVEMVEEVGDLHRRIAAILEGNPEAMTAWATLEHGFIAWHLSLGRYKLSELGCTW
ncbi:isoprenoid synthase domain-containing protein [Mycena vulgaris]|nr:isoprenoid synthase domain-containing protein [Mycena vulgaris]